MANILFTPEGCSASFQPLLLFAPRQNSLLHQSQVRMIQFRMQLVTVVTIGADPCQCIADAYLPFGGKYTEHWDKIAIMQHCQTSHIFSIVKARVMAVIG